MRKYLCVFILVICFGCSHDELIEITYKDKIVDTVMVNTQRFSLKNGTLKSIRSTANGDNFIVAENVRFYRILK